MNNIISVANQKGGVGKTTTSVNLASCLAHMGKRVLLVDIDPQGNATSGLGIDKSSLTSSIYDVFTGTFKLSSVIVGTELPSLWVAPSNTDLVAVEIELAARAGREGVLKEQLDQVTSQFDYIFIDCPPSLGVLTVNALMASGSLLIPLQSEYYALEGISALTESYRLARERLNPDLDLEGVVLTMYDGRTNLSRQVEQEARKFFGDLVFKTVIPRNVRLSESPSFGKPILLYDPTSVGSLAYLALAEEFEKRRSKQQKSLESKKKVGQK